MNVWEGCRTCPAVLYRLSCVEASSEQMNSSSLSLSLVCRRSRLVSSSLKPEAALTSGPSGFSAASAEICTHLCCFSSRSTAHCSSLLLLSTNSSVTCTEEQGAAVSGGQKPSSIKGSESNISVHPFSAIRIKNTDPTFHFMI